MALTLPVLLLTLSATGAEWTMDGRSAAEDPALLTAVAQHVRATLPDGEVAVDPRYAHRAHKDAGDRFEGDMPSAELNAVTLGLQAEARNREQVVRCDRPLPSACSLSGADVFVTVTRPIVDGEKAILSVNVVTRSGSARQPFATVQREITLARSAAGWVVTSDREVAVS